MSAPDVPTPRAATRAATRPASLLTPLELLAAGLALLVLLLIYSIEVRSPRMLPHLYADGRNGLADDRWLFLPHLALLALIVAGLRRPALALSALMLIVAAIAGFLALAASAFGESTPLQGLVVVALVQGLLFWACVQAARDAGATPLQPPRIALGALAGAVGWIACTAALAQLDAPRVAAVHAVQQSLLRRHNEEATRARLLEVARCLQRVPAGADSQPLFPASLSELTAAGCTAATGAAPPGFRLDYNPGAADSAGARHHFVLSAHEEPLTDSSRTWTIDEQFRVVERYGLARQGPASAGDTPLRALAIAGRCVEAARDTTTGRYPASLAEAQRMHPCELRLTSDSAAMIVGDYGAEYLVRYAAPRDSARRTSPGGYALSMEPSRDRAPRAAFASFLADTAGRVHVTLRPRAATTADPVIPDCPADYRAPRAPYCSEYRARQRWGLSDALPSLSWSMSGNGTVASGDTLHVIPHYRGLLAQDSVVEARIRWSAGERDSVIRRRGDGIGEVFVDAVIFRLKHVYRDTGYKEIHFSVRTRANEIYEVKDSVRVLVGWRRDGR